jgi:D-sedoheptulose 7-phosphate isomerase
MRAEGRPGLGMTGLLDRAATDREGPGMALAEDAEAIVRAARDMAVRFRAGGGLLTVGAGAAAADAGHIAVEFTHPVIVGKRALPAVSLAGDAAAMSGLGRTGGCAGALAGQVRLLGRPGDIAVGVHAAEGDGVPEALRAASDSGLLTIALTREGTGTVPAGDHVLTAHTRDPLIARELHITIYHVLWELVHVFLEHPEALEPEATDDGTS